MTRVIRKIVFISAILARFRAIGKWRLRQPWRNLGLFAGVLAGLGPPNANAEAGPPVNAFSLDATGIVDTLAVLAGGQEKGVRVLAKGDLKLTYDGSATSHPWLSALVELGAFSGGGISAGALGDTQGISNIEFVRSVRVLNAWVEATAVHASLKAGVMDVNVDFDEQNIAAIFLNASHGVGAELSHSGLNGPSSAPNSALGAVAALFDVGTGTRFRVGLFDGCPNDPARPAATSFALRADQGGFAIAELDRSTPRGRIALGVWHYTARLPILGTNAIGRGSGGSYAIAEGPILGRSDGPQLSGWIRAGFASAAYNPITAYLGAGLVANRFWPTYPADTIGFAMANARANPRSGPGAGNETTFELTAQHKLANGLFIQPDLQYVVNPGGHGDVADGLAGGVRLIISHRVL